MFEQYEELAKEQYPDFNFDGWEIEAVMSTIHGFEEGSYDDYFDKIDYLPFAYKIPNGNFGCVFTNANPIIDDQMFFMVNTQGMK